MFRSFSISHADQSTKDDARQSLIHNIVVSFIPLIIAFFVLAFPGKLEFGPNIYKAFLSVFLSGQLYFYAMSLCASITLLSTQSGQLTNRGMRQWSVVFVLFCVSFMVLFIAQNPNSTPQITFHSILSVIFLLLAIFLNFRVMVLANQPPPLPEDSNRRQAAAVAEASEPNYDK